MAPANQISVAVLGVAKPDMFRLVPTWEVRALIGT